MGTDDDGHFRARPNGCNINMVLEGIEVPDILAPVHIGAGGQLGPASLAGVSGRRTQ